MDAVVASIGAGVETGAAGLVTVADITFAVTLGAPAELVVDPEAVATAVLVGGGVGVTVVAAVAEGNVEAVVTTGAPAGALLPCVTVTLSGLVAGAG